MTPEGGNCSRATKIWCAEGVQDEKKHHLHVHLANLDTITLDVSGFDVGQKLLIYVSVKQDSSFNPAKTVDVCKAGSYRTRWGGIAYVSMINKPDDASYPVSGIIAVYGELMASKWQKNGESKLDPMYDLIEFIVASKKRYLAYEDGQGNLKWINETHKHTVVGKFMPELDKVVDSY